LPALFEIPRVAAADHDCHLHVEFVTCLISSATDCETFIDAERLINASPEISAGRDDRQTVPLSIHFMISLKL
jgi:hypothetical protein